MRETEKDYQHVFKSNFEGQKKSYPLELEVHAGSCEQPNMVSGN